MILPELAIAARSSLLSRGYGIQVIFAKKDLNCRSPTQSNCNGIYQTDISDVIVQPGHLLGENQSSNASSGPAKYVDRFCGVCLHNWLYVIQGIFDPIDYVVDQQRGLVDETLSLVTGSDRVDNSWSSF